MLLYAHAFRPKIAISSTANRCFQTASFYMAGKESLIMTLEALHVFGDIVQMREKANDVLNLIEKAAGNEREVLVVSHDCMSVALAWTVLERRGVAVNWWLPRELRFLEQGEGLLVKDKTYWHLHNNAKLKIR
jgi:broad specificity phosphatase PhoE